MPHTSLGFVPGSVEELNYAKEKIVSYTTKLNFLNAEKVSSSASVRLA